MSDPGRHAALFDGLPRDCACRKSNTNILVMQSAQD